MKFYFILGLILSLILSGALFALIVRRLYINRSRQNRHALFYLLPVILTIIFSMVVWLDTKPRILDTPAVLRGNLPAIEIVGTDVEFSGAEIKYRNTTYHLLPGLNIDDSVSNYRALYAPHTHIILSIEPIQATPD